MKLVSLNVEFNKHLDLNLPFIKNEMPDVLCLQEVLEEDIPKFKELLGYDAVFHAWSYITHPAYPDHKGRKQGVAVLAKNIEKSEYFFYTGSEANIAMPFEEYDGNQKNKVVIVIETTIEGKTFKIATTHLPVTEEGASTPYQLEVTEAMLQYLKPLGELVLCGDMNAPRGNETFALLNSVYKDNIPAEYKTSIDQHLHRFPGLQFMVDCLFTTESYNVTAAKLVDNVSDHMAIVATIEKK